MNNLILSTILLVVLYLTYMVIKSILMIKLSIFNSISDVIIVIITIIFFFMLDSLILLNMLSHI